MGGWGISLESGPVPPKNRFRPWLLCPGCEQHRVVQVGSNWRQNKGHPALLLEAILGDTAFSGGFTSRLCQILPRFKQRGQKSAVFQLSANVSKSKFAWRSWDLRSRSLKRLNSPCTPPPPPFYWFCLFAFCFSFQISLSQTVRLVTVSLQPQGGAELISLPI